MKEIELKNLRKRREKHFLQEDGTIIAKVYNEDIHFKKDNEYEEIDNTLIKVNDCYINKNNEYKVCFKEFTTEEIMQIQEQDYYIETSLKNSNKVQLKKQTLSSKLFDSVKYENILNNIDIEYNIFPTKVKENIILKNSFALVNEIEFFMRTNLQFVANADGSISALAQDKVAFKLVAPYMYDSNNKINRNVSYSFEKVNGGYNLKLILDKKWLVGEETMYPIVIDPTIATEDDSVYDTYIYPGDNGIDRNSQDILKVGVEKSGNNEIINRALIKFDLPTIGTGSQVISAMLNLVGYITPEISYESDIVNVHRVTESWTEGNANWSTMNDKYDSRVECSFDSYRSYVNSDNSLSARINGGNITSLVKKWYSGLENFGVLLKENKEVYRSNIIPSFYSKNNTVLGDNPKPVLEITYRNQNGIENYMDYKTQPFANGVAYFNSYNGNLTTIFNLMKTVGGKFPVDLQLVYNTNDVVLENNVGLGIGYRFNLQQTISVSNIAGYLEYIDADGTIHYFKNQNNEYKDEDGLNMTIKLSGNLYELSDKHNNKMLFTKNDDVGYLTEIIDASNNKILINYNSTKQINKIIDANNSEINITYESNKTVITDGNFTIILNIIDNKIASIENVTGNTSFYYNENDIISSIIDENGKKISYEYYSESPYRLKKVSEYGVENTLGQFFEIFYNYNSTTIIDNKNRVNTMTFNDSGNLVSVSNLASGENLKFAYGNKYHYNQIIESEYVTNPFKNKLLSADIQNMYVKNYLKNTSFESTNIDFISTGNMNVSITGEEAEYGLKSLKIVNNEAGSYISKSLVLEKGQNYTFSCFIKNTNSVKLGLSYIDTNNEPIQIVSESILSNSDFQRGDITINYPINANSDLTLKIIFEEVGTTYIDGVQLEVGEVANYYNMLENSDFSDGVGEWNLSVEDNKTFEVLSPADYFEVVSINENGDKALKVTMNPANISRFNKKFYINGKAGDTYSLSFWYKNEAFPTTGLMGDPVCNDVMIFYNYLDNSSGHGLNGFTFNPNDNDWQYFSQSFTAEKDFDSLEVNFYQSKNANNLHITNLCLFRDFRTIIYDYDENGNIITTTALNNSVNEFNYDKNNQLISMINPKGKKFKFEYDNNVVERVINGISDTGISNQIKYDSFGNPILTKVIKNNSSNEISSGIYKMRLKGTEKYLRNIKNNLKMLEGICDHDLWYFEKTGEYYKIKHSIIQNKYLTISNSQITLTSFDNDSSLFLLIKNENGSYFIKNKSSNLYLKVNNEVLELAELIEDDYRFEFYFETASNELFIENSAEYTDDGKFIKSTTDSLFNKTVYEIDPFTGLTKSITNAKNQTTNYNYNNKNQLESVTNGNRSVNYTYNSSNLISKIKQGNKEYIFNYDEFLNNQSVKLGNDITLVTNNYENNNGNLISNVYGNNQTINYEYDNFDRIKKMIKMNDTYHYKYNNTGDLVKIISNNDIINYTYDLSKRLSEYKFNDFKINYKYDVNNNIIDIDYKYGPRSYHINNTYDGDDSVVKTSFENENINYIYDELGRLSNKNINNQFNTNYKYVTNGQRTSLLVNSVENNNGTYSYKYDKLNNITHIYHDGNLENRYYYDEYNQLIIEKNYIMNQYITYNYDMVGNLLEKKIYDLNTYNIIKVNKYEYNNGKWEDQLTKFNDKIITYDEIGNPIAIGSDIALSWINGRQLHSYEDNDNLISFKYDKDGRRINKIVNNVETKYYLEGENIVLEKTGSNVLYYIYNSVEDLIGFKYNDNVYFYDKNLQDDIVGILDSNYNIVAKYTYDSWGNILSVTDNEGNVIGESADHIANINPFRYRSYYYDKETKLYYLNDRYYNPEIGRFINIDVGISNIGEIDGYNMYVYAVNNPITYYDNDGCWPKLSKWLKKNIKKVAIGVAVIAVCAVATVVTGGAAAGVAGYIASTALKTAVVGAVVGAVSGAITSTVKNRVTTGSWEGSGKAAVDGATSGFASGAVTGAITGAISGAAKIASAASNWSAGNFNSGYDSMNYHYKKHVINESPLSTSNIVSYTDDAIRFSERNQSLLNFTNNYKYQNQTWNYSYTGQGGIFDKSGKIISFWYK